MKSQMRMRHWCDFCKKAGASSYHMARHEAVCTMNPNRHCKMCAAVGEYCQPEMAEMLVLLPDPAVFMVTTEYSPSYSHTSLNDEAIKPAIAAALPALRELTHDCPVCMLAAFRQRKIPVPLAVGFDYKAEVKALWSDISDSRREDY